MHRIQRWAAVMVLGASAPLLHAAAADIPAATKVTNPVAFNEETKVRQQLIQVSLGRETADVIIRGANVLNTYTLLWLGPQDIVVKGKRIAWVGPVGQWKGKATTVFDAKGLWAVPGFGESHKHIESTLLSPEYEAALVVPLGNTWTSEGSHEFSNVSGEHNVEFWLAAEKAGSPLKIFPALGSATPPSAFEVGGGYYAYREVAKNMQASLRVQGLDEVMDWPAVSEPSHPGYQRIWEDMQATRDNRGVIDGHGSGLTDLDRINAFAASGLTSDHETRIAEEAWEKLQRGLFLQLRDDTAELAIPLFVKNGLKEWGNISLVTDDRNVADTIKQGTMNTHVQLAIKLGAPPEAAYAMASLNPARHARIDDQVGSLAPGRYADVVLLSSVKDVGIKYVFANGQLAGKDGKYQLPIPKISWPSWATDTIKVGRKLTAKDFEIVAPPGKTTVTAVLQKEFYTDPEQKTGTLPVVNGVVQRDVKNDITKAGNVDRYTGKAALGKVFWNGIGPKSPDSAIATSVSHDLHNITVIGTSDEAMAAAVNRVIDLKGGIVLVKGGKVIAEMKLEIGGLMTARPIAEAAADMENIYAKADTMEWVGSARLSEVGHRRDDQLQPRPPGAFVVPYPGNPLREFVLMQTGKDHADGVVAP